jgi:hypothetical protein
MEYKINAWINTVTKTGCIVHSFSVLQEIRKPDGELLFALLDTHVTSPEGTSLPRIVFIRGHACVIVPLIIDNTTNEQKYVMVKQRRIGNGDLCVEFPAGMLDENNNDPLGIAICELHEEVGIDVTRADLFLLHPEKLYSSVGGSDEGVYFFGCIIKTDHAAMNNLHNRITGKISEGENITVALMSRKDAEAQATAMQIPVGFYLFDKYLQSNTNLF